MATALSVAGAVVQAKYYSSFQLTHTSRDDRAQSIKSAMAAKGKTINYYSTHSFASTVNFGMKATVNDNDHGRQPSGQDLCGPFRKMATKI